MALEAGVSIEDMEMRLTRALALRAIAAKVGTVSREADEEVDPAAGKKE